MVAFVAVRADGPPRLPGEDAVGTDLEIRADEVVEPQIDCHGSQQVPEAGGDKDQDVTPGLVVPDTVHDVGGQMGL